ncbi:MAG: hypothetical protein JKX81_03030 [Arenicella sp.]|nr:hypothetical protein [Arenicella sp.]
MAKQSDVKDTQIDRNASTYQNEPNYSELEEFEFDDDDFFEQYTKHSPKGTTRSQQARRRIEQLSEERELKKRLNECYFDE